MKKLSLLPRIAIAIVLGILCGFIFPDWATRLFLTVNMLFGNFLGFVIPLLILSLVAYGIADIGRGAGRLLAVTAVLAYCFTLFSGFFTYFTCDAVYPFILSSADHVSLDSASEALTPYFNIEMPPVMGVMTALIMAFVIGLGVTMIKGDTLKMAIGDLKDVILKVISGLIIPLLPLYIFGIFIGITSSGEVMGVMSVFLKIIIVVFVMTIILLLLQFSIAGIISRKNPLKLLRNMLPAYFTALGLQSSAATIPVTLEQTLKNDVDSDVADFTVPLCATIHLSGSTMKIVACAMAIMIMTGMPFSFGLFAGFIMMLGVTMVAAPGVPGGAIMAALGLLGSMLGFDEAALGLMIALYIAMDSFGTACNVTGDGAIAVIVNEINKVWKRKSTKEGKVA